MYSLEKYYSICEGLRDLHPELLEENNELMQKVLIIESMTASLTADIRAIIDEEDED